MTEKEQQPPQSYRVTQGEIIAALEGQVRDLKARNVVLEAKAGICDVFRDWLREIKKHRDKPDYVAHELTQALNSFEDNYDASATRPDARRPEDA